MMITSIWLYEYLDFFVRAFFLYRTRKFYFSLRLYFRSINSHQKQ